MSSGILQFYGIKLGEPLELDVPLGWTHRLVNWPELENQTALDSTVQFFTHFSRSG